MYSGAPTHIKLPSANISRNVQSQTAKLLFPVRQECTQHDSDNKRTAQMIYIFCTTHRGKCTRMNTRVNGVVPCIINNLIIVIFLGRQF